MSENTHGECSDISPGLTPIRRLIKELGSSGITYPKPKRIPNPQTEEVPKSGDSQHSAN